ncbi:helix-turn-helix domain-containing protein [Luteibacter aegosomatissinici]|uniref:helix-turn-helix domain-containing protein n=1 Tax=Luteibacter aegosomatissinici TaxID=2911539 RepID=UPI001FF99481|nr:AraC family transcriptional regulator [Luteibacter aegosomatissinici]UPG92563.1 AraC family transcriptional regulator [Luteibacter aegosomatissinici]
MSDVEGMPYGFIIDRRDALASYRTGGSLAAMVTTLQRKEGLVRVPVADEETGRRPFLVAFREHHQAVEELGFVIGPASDAQAQDPALIVPAIATALCLLLMKLAEKPLFAQSLFAEVALALRSAYGVTSGGVLVRRPAGGLYPWQSDRAVAFMDASLSSPFTTADVARACNMSANHFARAFRVTHGIPPRQWLLRRRVARAKEMLADARTTLTDVALSCGFAEQSHFTRVFTRIEGMPPGAWRRSGRAAP